LPIIKGGEGAIVLSESIIITNRVRMCSNQAIKHYNIKECSLALPIITQLNRAFSQSQNVMGFSTLIYQGMLLFTMIQLNDDLSHKL